MFWSYFMSELNIKYNCSIISLWVHFVLWSNLWKKFCKIRKSSKSQSADVCPIAEKIASLNENRNKNLVHEQTSKLDLS